MYNVIRSIAVFILNIISWVINRWSELVGNVKRTVCGDRIVSHCVFDPDRCKNVISMFGCWNVIDMIIAFICRINAPSEVTIVSPGENIISVYDAKHDELIHVVYNGVKTVSLYSTSNVTVTATEIIDLRRKSQSVFSLPLVAVLQMTDSKSVNISDVLNRCVFVNGIKLSTFLKILAQLRWMNSDSYPTETQIDSMILTLMRPDTGYERSIRADEYISI